jgi:BirA family biotin operon repressor/biotin-[acetyl-CoA-carboxylase] ligase
MFSREIFQEFLETESLGREFHLLPQTASTNTDAWNYIENGALHGTVIFTDDQHSGRGRRNLKWISRKEKSLTFSIILTPEFSGEELGLLPLLTGVAIVRAIRNLSKLKPGLKWPNDIFLNGKKAGGILIETKIISGNFFAVTGIGLNVNDTVDGFPEEIKNRSTSLFAESGIILNREELLAEILLELEQLLTRKAKDIISLWEGYCIHRDIPISFHLEDEIITGNFQRITPKGHAQIFTNGRIKEFSSGVLTL